MLLPLDSIEIVIMGESEKSLYLEKVGDNKVYICNIRISVYIYIATVSGEVESGVCKLEDPKE